MLDEGVVPSPKQVDLAMIMGAGFPFWLGGLTPYLDRSGISDRGVRIAVRGKRLGAPGHIIFVRSPASTVRLRPGSFRMSIGNIKPGRDRARWAIGAVPGICRGRNLPARNRSAPLESADPTGFYLRISIPTVARCIFARSSKA